MAHLPQRARKGTYCFFLVKFLEVGLQKLHNSNINIYVPLTSRNCARLSPCRHGYQNGLLLQITVYVTHTVTYSCFQNFTSNPVKCDKFLKQYSFISIFTKVETLSFFQLYVSFTAQKISQSVLLSERNPVTHHCTDSLNLVHYSPNTLQNDDQITSVLPKSQDSTKPCGLYNPCGKMSTTFQSLRSNRYQINAS